MAKDKIQSIKIILTDGRTGIFSGRALFDPTKEDVTVQEMQVSEPRDVPDGYSMEIIDECDELPVEVPMADDDGEDEDDTGNGGLLH
jgi:hypothetical protein